MLGIVVDGERDAAVPARRPDQVGEGGADVVVADVDADRVTGVGREREHLRRAAGAGPGRAGVGGFVDEARVDQVVDNRTDGRPGQPGALHEFGAGEAAPFGQCLEDTHPAQVPEVDGRVGSAVRAGGRCGHSETIAANGCRL